MRYYSTRGGAQPVTAGQAILKGLADDGGLYVPESFPHFTQTLSELAELSYPELAYEILRLYLTDYDDDTLRACIEKAYTYPGNFDDPVIAPLIEAGGMYFLELFHGRTLAFKDMALSLLPYLLTAAAARYRPGLETIVLTATSGDTGKAALEGFANVEHVKVAVFFPEDGVSKIQKCQMVTQEGDNTCVIGVRGNFDDTQTGVKQIFNDRDLTERMDMEGLAFSSANSINIGRLLPQIVYYVYAYGQLIRRGVIHPGDTVNFTVPTGNFGNILAGYYARQMGLPIGKLVCASNSNHVLTDFFHTGVYDMTRDFHMTISPSMDILLSSNLERLLYHASGEDAGAISLLMEELRKKGRFTFDHIPEYFYAAFATEDETRAAIRNMAKHGYTLDPHTAVAYHAHRSLTDEVDSNIPQIVIATASPYKFAADVCAAIKSMAIKSEETPAVENVGFSALDTLAQLSGTSVPDTLKSLRNKKTRHTTVCRVEDMQQTLIDTVIFPPAR